MVKKMTVGGNKKLVLWLVVASLIAACVVPLVMADTFAEIYCSVTTSSISVYVDNTDIEYGVIGTGSSKSSDNITATNGGNVPENFTIRGANAVPQGGGMNWTLANTTAKDQYRHTFKEAIPSPPPETNLLSTPTLLASNVATDGGTKTFKLTLYTPTEITTTETTFDTTVTIVASEA
jgi:hypothetical protein